jgi:hypothetical protein
VRRSWGLCAVEVEPPVSNVSAVPVDKFGFGPRSVPYIKD